jgi:hypothetical protein
MTNDEIDYKYILFESPQAIKKQEKARDDLYNKDRKPAKYEVEARKFTAPKYRRGDVLVLFAPVSCFTGGSVRKSDRKSKRNPDNDHPAGNGINIGRDMFIAISDVKVDAVSDPSTTLGEYLYTVETTGGSVGEVIFTYMEAVDRVRKDLGHSNPQPYGKTIHERSIPVLQQFHFTFNKTSRIVLHVDEIITIDDYKDIKRRCHA